MKAITICQPYASLIATGQKFVENRSWETTHRRWLAIHAGKNRKFLESWHPEPGEVNQATGNGQQATDQLPSASCLLPGCEAPLPFGAIVAVAWVTTCLRFNEIDAFAGFHPKYAWLQNHEHVEGPYCWVLSRVVPLTSPVQVNGAQGLWTVPKDVVAQMRASWSKTVFEPGVAAVVGG